MSLSGFITSLNPPPHPSWNGFLTAKNCQLLDQIEKEIKSTGREFTPPSPFVLRFLQVPVENIKIIILGQDPYPQRGVATGRAFEVGTLKSWHDKFSNISLKNIVRAIYNACSGKILKYSEIMRLSPGDFTISPPGKLFSSWEEQGVLLLNTSFTVETGKPGSHAKIWENFSSLLLRFLSLEKPDLIWFLWGNHAKQITKDLPLNNVLKSQHPMMCYEGQGRKDDFLFGEINPFKETIHLVDWRGDKDHPSSMERNIQTAFPFDT
jgi:uracil-DNA glycosylase